jgi:2-dehydro-3-deoxyphosphogluconate aldolase/(4S)-4-hydroxy-2-oxoglutarate aldolase
MVNISKAEVYKEIISTGMMPLFYYGDNKKAIKVARAVYDGSCNILEFTNRGSMAAEVFDHLIRSREHECPEMIIGAGSIIDVDTASQYIEIGTDFIVGPNLDEDIANLCNKKNIVYIPGAATPNEMVKASKLGSDIIKVFPASTLGGPEFIKAVLGPMPWLKLMPTGGVTTDNENIEKWFKAGVVCIGIGSCLINNQIIKEEDYKYITESVLNIRKNINKIRNNPEF